MPTKLPILRLTERDYDLLDALGDYRFLSVPQAAALFFPSAGSAARRLRELVAAKLALPVFLPVRPWTRASETVYALAGKGAVLLAPRHNGLRPRHLTAREQRSGLFLEHTLRRNDVRIAFDLLQLGRSDFTQFAWQQNPDQVRASAVVKLGVRTEARVPIVPDGVALVRIGGQHHVLAIEIDMGTVPVVRMWRRYRAYWKWWRLGGPRLRYGPVPYRVLTLVPDEKRLKALAAVAARAPENRSRGSRLFWFATLDAADITTPQKIIGAVWRPATEPLSPPEPLFPPERATLAA
ncbi:MAG: replication-relaxation family protein [Myxococcota bacterium]